MKKLMTALAVCAAASISLAAAGVTSANIVGFQTITLQSNTLNQLSLNWVEVGTAATSIPITNLFEQGQAQANLRAEVSGNKAVADQLLVWDGLGYSTYYYRKTSTGSVLGWANYNNNAIATDSMPLGIGFWIVRNGTSNTTLTVAKQVNVASLHSHVFSSNNITMFGSGFTAPMPLNDPRWNWAAAGAKAEVSGNKAIADQILVWDGLGYATYYYRKTSTGSILGWANYNNNAITTDSIAIGNGAWYLRNGTTDIVVDETKPY